MTPLSVPPQETLLDQFDKSPAVVDVVTERQAYIKDTYKLNTLLVQSYLEGSRISVTYFHRLENDGKYRDHTVDNLTSRGYVNVKLTRINEFELTIPQGENLSLTYDSTSAESEVKGSALVYPGISPNIGDMFLMDMNNGQFGLFFVVEITPLAVHQDRVHRIDYVLKKYFDTETKEFLKQATVDVKWFDKAVYMSGSRALLTSDDVITLNDLRSTRLNVIRDYVNRFYNSSDKSFWHPNGYYDPYIVKFIQYTVDTKDLKYRPSQLLPEVVNDWNFTIWARLLEIKNKSIRDLCAFNSLVRSIRMLNSPMVTPVTSGTILTLIKDPNNEIYDDIMYEYILGSSFYRGEVESMSPLESVIYKAITTRSIPSPSYVLTDDVFKYWVISDKEKFEHGPLYMWLLNMAANSYLVAKHTT